MNLHDAELPPHGNSYRFNSTATHATTALPDALKNRYLTINAYVQDVFVLFGVTSTIEVDRAVAPANTTDPKLGEKIEKDTPGGVYRFWVSEHFTHISVESSATAFVIVRPSSRQDTPPSPRADHT